MNFDTFEELYSLGWNPIPVFVYLSQDMTRREKRPPVKWKHFADDPTLYSPELIKEWKTSTTHQEALGVALITGKQRDGTFVICVDIDPPKNNSPLVLPDDLLEASLSTMQTTTPSGGRHIYFKYEGHLPLTNKVNIFNANKDTETVIDLRAKSGLSVIGHTPIWEWNWKADGSKSNSSRKTTPKQASPNHQPYVTQDYFSPSSLAPLPDSIVTRFTQLAVESASFSTTSDAKRLYTEILSHTPSSASESSIHSLLLSWSMKLIASYLPLITTEEQATSLYTRFRGDIDYLVQERKLTPSKRQLDEQYLERLFYSGIAKLKKNRDVNYTLAKPFLDPLLSQRVAEAQRTQWEPLKVTQILDYSTHLYLTNEDATKGFELQHNALARQQEWRTRHLIAFGAPMLPKISSKAFEAILSDIPIHQRQSNASSPKLATQAILSDWLADIATVGNEASREHAMRQAITLGYSGYTTDTHTHVLFKLREVQDNLRDDGFGTVSIPKVAQLIEECGSFIAPDSRKLWEIKDVVEK